LARRYSGSEPSTWSGPPLPDWCFEEEGEEKEEEIKGEEAGEKDLTAKLNGIETNNEVTAAFAIPLDDVQFVADPAVRSDVQKTCQRVLGWGSLSFPGGQPVSMDVQNIRLINEQPYRVSWKADGTR
jgi:mRNA-capping enzyme